MRYYHVSQWDCSFKSECLKRSDSGGINWERRNLEEKELRMKKMINYTQTSKMVNFSTKTP